MASRQDFRMDGFKELEKALKELGPPVATKAGTEGLRKATNVMRDAVKAKAPKGDQPTKRTWRNKDGTQNSADYGRLKQNIKTRKVRSRRQHTVSYKVTTGSAFWGRFSEFGTEHEPARPWFKPAIDEVAGRVVQALQDELKKAIDKAARKART
ncbi:phage protein, HK97 gp10 family [Sphingomonas gellani]|uniref:Phage protein, HK97 gp10 family n=1 Tax=Sphingomonas gellani TaxID=1166340 RepID=A0A1H7Y456_9SPHN|nr:HK97-gp10 family putative phage morphogenesis protein [Sphingomonas gellani]SEM40664.1 phage protein, HK97 gp10 family [Sphingomonas gellani]